MQKYPHDAGTRNLRCIDQSLSLWARSLSIPGVSFYTQVTIKIVGLSFGSKLSRGSSIREITAR